MSSKTASPAEELLRQVAAYQQENPRAYLRTVAAELGSNEAQLMAIQSGQHIIQLEPDVPALLKMVEKAGRLTSICRNDGAVSEISGSLEIKQESKEQAYLAIDESEILIDKQMLGYAFFARQGERNSLQFYDLAGDSAVKFFFKENIPDFAGAYLPGPTFLKTVKKTSLNNFQNIDNDNLAVGTACRQLIEGIAGQQVSIDIIVENFAVQQRFRGAINKVVDARGWFNILDENYNLHLKEDSIEKTTLVHSEQGAEINAFSKTEKLVSLRVDQKKFNLENLEL